MKDFLITRFDYEIICDGETSDTSLDFETENDRLGVFITAINDRPRFVKMSWSFESGGDIFVLGDAWERSYADLGFRKLADNGRAMPWYFAATDKKSTFCLGVETQPNSFVSFRYDESGVTALIDCRNGGSGVKLGGRKVKLCTFVYSRYALEPFEALCCFCREMCKTPILPEEVIYGGNNWYYAYGKSSYEEIISNSALQAELSEGIENCPFMVIDDGWQINSCKGPYLPNEKFRDMKTLAGEIKSLGVRPGIWVRLLDNASDEITDDMKILRGGKREYLDPTDSRVKDFIRRDIERIKSWGYEMLKHDFSTVDLFGNYGKDLTDTITNCENWHFVDETKTNAEIVLDFYRLIKEACGDMLIIGCNTVSHLCAGLVHINRTGDDTSGREWDRTRRMGVNTLAFRLCQNKAFYLADADCVGILDDNIPWEKNRQWLDVLSKSDTALFTSCAALDDRQREDMKRAYEEIQKPHSIKPLDIYENLTPCEWEIDGEKTVYNWD